MFSLQQRTANKPFSVPAPFISITYRTRWLEQCRLSVAMHLEFLAERADLGLYFSITNGGRAGAGDLCRFTSGWLPIRPSCQFWNVCVLCWGRLVPAHRGMAVKSSLIVGNTFNFCRTRTVSLLTYISSSQVTHTVFFPKSTRMVVWSAAPGWHFLVGTNLETWWQRRRSAVTIPLSGWLSTLD